MNLHRRLTRTIAVATFVVVGAIGLLPAAASADVGDTDAAMSSPMGTDRTRCMSERSMSGPNAYAWGRTSSLSDYSQYIRLAPIVDLCIKYARAYGGYYFDSAVCRNSAARLVTGKTLTKTNGYNHVLHFETTSVGCETGQDWKWDRTAPVANQCASLYSAMSWRIDQATGTVTRTPGVYARDDYFVPESNC